MRLFIAEKPSVAKAIASELGGGRSQDGSIACGSDVVTWCFGHMLEQAEPDDYTPGDVPRTDKGRKIWRTDELPIIPEHWKLVPVAKTKKQLATIGRLLKKADLVVNAGDPDREGQLLVDEVLEHFACDRPVQRFWVSAQDSVSIQRGLSELRDNRDYAGMADAARARQRADWLVGMNLSRAYTLRAERGGSRTLLTVGRVQTPTLALVVERDRQIEAFVPKPYYLVRAELEHAAGSFVGTYKPAEDAEGLDPEGRLVDIRMANKIAAAITGRPAAVTEYKTTHKRKAPPLPFSLSDLTLLASQKYSMTAEQTLAACQALYESHKLTSYPRTDCGHLPVSQHADAPKVLAAVEHTHPALSKLVQAADPARRSPAWNDDKVTAHHGIIPTMQSGSVELPHAERKIYDLVARRYVAQFLPDHEYDQTKVLVHIDDWGFAASGRTVTAIGWKAAQEGPEAADEEQGGHKGEEQRLPAMAVGDPLLCKRGQRKDDKTRPSPRFTDGSLIRAMEQVHKYVSSPEHKKLLRQGDGIGTSATRATIISELKRRKFLQDKGKHVLSTELGRQLVDVLPEAVKSAALTALYERMLSDIESGRAELRAFVSSQEQFVRKRVDEAGQGAVTIAAAAAGSKHRCRACGKPLSRRMGKKSKSRFWGCTAYPDCKQTYPDRRGRPSYRPKPEKDSAHA